MRLYFKTKVNQPYRQVFKQFDEQLFIKLKPPLLPMQLKRFDGSKTGDIVHIQLGISPFKQDWKSKITADGEREQELYFVDEGIELPFFLTKWKHQHIVKAAERGGSWIIDDIFYQTPSLFSDYIMYPVLYAQFAARKPIYKKIFD